MIQGNCIPSPPSTEPHHTQLYSIIIIMIIIIIIIVYFRDKWESQHERKEAREDRMGKGDKQRKRKVNGEKEEKKLQSIIVYFS